MINMKTAYGYEKIGSYQTRKLWKVNIMSYKGCLQVLEILGH